jgi:hypothetical protein
MGNSVGHDDVSLQDSDIVDKQLVVPLADGDRDAQQGLVFLPVFQSGRIRDVPDDTMVLERIGDLGHVHGLNVDTGSLECSVGGRKAGEFGGGVNEVGEVGSLERVKQGGETRGLGSLGAGTRKVKNPAGCKGLLLAPCLV